MLTQERLKQLLDYSPDTGLFYWRVDRGGIKAGSIAGARRESGYITISVDSRLYRAHQLAWLWMTGRWPAQFVDHKDMQKDNNRWANLREATKSQNQMNTRLQSNNTTGHKGVTWFKQYGKYQVMVWKNRKAHFIGYFETLEEAATARNTAAERIHGEFARAS
jgi:hypothetical protein